ncbi:hypothetical protein HK100_005688, partial [Physocladia obscura]
VPYSSGGIEWSSTDCALAACSCIENICAESCSTSGLQLTVRLAWAGTDANGVTLSSLGKPKAFNIKKVTHCSGSDIWHFQNAV